MIVIMSLSSIWSEKSQSTKFVILGNKTKETKLEYNRKSSQIYITNQTDILLFSVLLQSS